MGRSPFDYARFLRFVWKSPIREVDIDLLDFADPHPNAEETLIAAETFACRGFWSFGTHREKIPTTKGDRESRKASIPSGRSRPRKGVKEA